MNRPVRPDRVTVSLSPEAAALLEEQVADGKFASLDEAADAAMFELRALQAPVPLEDDAALREVFGDFAEDDDRSSDVDAEAYFAEVLAEMARRREAQRG